MRTSVPASASDLGGRGGRGDDTGDNTYVLDRDEELLDLIPFLLLLKDLRDVRSVLRLRVRHHSKECTTAADAKCTTVKAAMRVEENKHREYMDY